MTGFCPACVGAADFAADRATAGSAAASERILLHLPDIRCAACIASVETTLSAMPGVQEARVNLSRKQAVVSGWGLDPAPLIDALAKAGHRAQTLDEGMLAGQSDEMRGLLLRTGIAGFAMMNVMLLSVAVWSGAADTTQRMFHLISAAIALPAVAYSGRPFFASAFGALRNGRLNMDVPISLAILLSAVVSLIGAVQGADRHSWFDASLALTFFLLIGRTLDHAGRSAARSAAAELSALTVPQAVLLTPEGERVVRAEDLRAGDRIRVRPGDRLPADGTVEHGLSDVDRSALTGESATCPVAIGAPVSAGEVNLSGPLTIRVLRAGKDTALSRLAELVATAEMQRSRFTGIADRAARAYAPLVHILGLVAFVAWWHLTGDAWRAIDVAIAVLVITCPCALGLAVPAVSVVATGRLFRKGLLVKSPTALERLAEIDVVAFDKTGTLTTGEARLQGAPRDAELALAAALASGSTHPYSRALIAATKARGIVPGAVEKVVERPGLGIDAIVEGRTVRLGRPSWIGTTGDGVALDDGSGEPILFTFGEDVRADAGELIARLRGAGLSVAMLSGDSRTPCRRVADSLGLDDVQCAMTPDDKAEWIRAKHRAGHRVLMVGDGLNDTGALSLAHASAALGSGLDAARAASDVVVLSGSLAGLADLVTVSRAGVRRMRQNILLSAGYNVVAVPLALAGLATPFLAAIAMSLSSVTVSLNALRKLR
ncbi:cadmium-translocating P-type ATPase [Paracoccus sp. TK19116]|uniref:Cadmium-translocating P-type ATPase n=1 Tax=Paracoccus albicereus TaxID=2922394 RepID=A0ABT1MXP4_9RHOB|nr:heavy metal translocating P-type ATPase [Paracoccus albicereus]MCQ0972108.1 cadmium-translocating P-type ATPase [Paracoccus albicereus]